MKELSLNILDIAQNSVSAGAKNILISLSEDSDGILTLEITDDGTGLSQQAIIDPAVDFDSVTEVFIITELK